MEKRKPEHIGKILNQLLRDNQWEKHLKASLPLLRWQEVVGAQIARQTQPEFLKDGVLHVRVGNSVWLNHLRFLSEDDVSTDYKPLDANKDIHVDLFLAYLRPNFVECLSVSMFERALRGLRMLRGRYFEFSLRLCVSALVLPPIVVSLRVSASPRCGPAFAGLRSLRMLRGRYFEFSLRLCASALK